MFRSYIFSWNETKRREKAHFYEISEINSQKKDALLANNTMSA
jgi:hypothetical protein